MPFADAARGVSGVLQDFGQREFVGGQAAGGNASHHPIAIVTHAATDGVAAGEKGGPAGSAHFRGRIKIGEPHPLPRHAVEMRRANARVPITAEVAVPQVIGKYEYDIWSTPRFI